MSLYGLRTLSAGVNSIKKYKFTLQVGPLFLPNHTNLNPLKVLQVPVRSLQLVLTMVFYWIQSVIYSSVSCDVIAAMLEDSSLASIVNSSSNMAATSLSFDSLGIDCNQERPYPLLLQPSNKSKIYIRTLQL